MGDFTVLPVWGGAGDWHFNRYRVVFMRPPNLSKQLLAQDFVTNFPQYLTSKYAKVVRTGYTYATMPTFHFHGYKMLPIPNPAGQFPARNLGTLDIDIAKPHSDWVVKIDDNDNLGFTAQTLKREFRDLLEDGPTKTAGIIGFLINPLLAVPFGEDDPMEVNRMHFLAGRRSWRLDDGKNFGVDGDVLVLETAAVERFSHKLYVTADSIVGLEKSVPDVWVAMLNNYVRMKGVVRVPQRLRPGWNTRADIQYYTKSFASFEAMAGDVEFAQQKRLGLFRTLVPAR